MKVIIIGAGASGLMAAQGAAAGGAQVTVLEKNEKAGKKIYITGKGRCNFTNACETQEFFDSVVTNPRFLYSAVYGFDAREVMHFFEENGCPVKVERGNRAFPVSDHASDITAALVRSLKRQNVRLLTRCEVSEILTEQEDGALRALGVRLTDGRTFHADAVIVCTGGLSYPATGSTGDGLAFARKLGLAVTPTAPALVPMTVKETWPLQLQGLSLKNVAVRVEEPPRNEEEKEEKRAEKKRRRGEKPVYEGFGEMLFTHFGVSGPLILSASSYCDFDRCRQFRLLLDLKPALSSEQLVLRIRREIEAGPLRHFETQLRSLFPARLAEVMAQLSSSVCGIAPERIARSLNEQEIRRFADFAKAVPLTLTGTRGYAEAVVTRGGVSVKEINPSTMESRKIPGLYFAGETLDVNALTGGFNLQIAWSTGMLAGTSAARPDDRGEKRGGPLKKYSSEGGEQRMNQIPVSIAIDGPAGAGKSTVAKLVAGKTGYIYVDTGAMYRAMALFLIRRGIPADDQEAISRVSQEADISIEYRDGEQVVLLNGENVNAFLRTEEVGKMASASSVNGDLRAKLVSLQQELGMRKSVVMDGRDIGTVVLPHAAVKIFLTASVEERAKRRFKELEAKGEKPDFATIAKDIEERDYRDSHRAISPLKQADDAVLIDSSNLTAEEVADRILEIWRTVK